MAVATRPSRSWCLLSWQETHRRRQAAIAIEFTDEELADSSDVVGNQIRRLGNPWVMVRYSHLYSYKVEDKSITRACRLYPPVHLMGSGYGPLGRGTGMLSNGLVTRRQLASVEPYFLSVLARKVETGLEGT